MGKTKKRYRGQMERPDKPGDQAEADRMLVELIEEVGLQVDAQAIIQAVRERGYTGAQFVSVALATSAMMDGTTMSIEDGIAAAVTYLDSRMQAMPDQP